MNPARPLRLPRPSFWPEPRAPEAWLRALDQLQPLLSATGQDFTPRSLWDAHLRRRLSLRSVPGLFGVDGSRLLGVGFLERDGAGFLRVTPGADAVLGPFRRKEPDIALAALAAHLLRWSAPLRLLLVRLARGDWALSGEAGEEVWQVGRRLVLRTHRAGQEWCRGIERECLGAWGPRFPDAESRGLRPDQKAAHASHNFGWGPLEGPMYLLDSLGWLGPDGQLRPPAHPTSDPDLAALLKAGNGPSPTDELRALGAAQADMRGLVAVEQLLRALRHRLGDPPLDGLAFQRWMDALCADALRVGAIEIEAAEPGQARHGRGLDGDRGRRLVRWQVHEAFNEVYGRHRQPPGVHPKGQTP